MEKQANEKEWWMKYVHDWPEDAPAVYMYDVSKIVAESQRRTWEEARRMIRSWKRPLESDFDEKVRNSALEDMAILIDDKIQSLK